SSSAGPTYFVMLQPQITVIYSLEYHHRHIHYHFFLNDPATADIYTLSLHDALPIWRFSRLSRPACARIEEPPRPDPQAGVTTSRDRKSTRLNSSHVAISYAVFCLKKKK